MRRLNQKENHPGPITVADRAKLFGSFSYTDLDGGRIRPDPAWVKRNIVRVEIPQLKGISIGGLEKSFSGIVYSHRLAAGHFRSVFAEIAVRNLTSLIVTFDGLYVPRHIAWDRKRGLSNHSWGTAIDLNSRWNPYGRKPAAWNAHGTVRPLVEIFEMFGFAWGGWWEGQHKDGMHFELVTL